MHWQNAIKCSLTRLIVLCLLGDLAVIWTWFGLRALRMFYVDRRTYRRLETSSAAENLDQFVTTPTFPPDSSLLINFKHFPMATRLISWSLVTINRELWGPFTNLSMDTDSSRIRQRSFKISNREGRGKGKHASYSFLLTVSIPLSPATNQCGCINRQSAHYVLSCYDLAVSSSWQTKLEPKCRSKTYLSVNLDLSLVYRCCGDIWVCKLEGSGI